jgi:hypothetical protein
MLKLSSEVQLFVNHLALTACHSEARKKSYYTLKLAYKRKKNDIHCFIFAL